MSSPDHAVRDLTVSRPRLRSDLRFTFQDFRGRPSYILEDLTHRRYFQIGLSEYQFLRSMDGRRSARELLAQNARDIGERALSEHDASVLLRWLVDQKLLETDSADQSGRRYRSAADKPDPKKQPLMQKLFFFKIPLGNPDPYFTKLLPWLKWTTSTAFVLFWAALISYAGFVLLQNWRPFIRSSTAAVLPQNWLYLGISYVALKLIHETWHGIVAKRFGSVIPECGIQLLVFVTPLTYVDASGSWQFSNRWHRIYVAAAGMFIELFLAALAILVWVRTGPGVINTMAYNTIFAASTITVLFNANPLMRFDGYYILSDLIRVPNLATKGQQFVQWLNRKILYGIKDQPPPAFLAQPVAVGTYGVLAYLWRWVIWIGIMAVASLMFKGAGVVLVAISVAGLLITTMVKSTKYLFTGSGGPRPSLVRAFAQLSGILIAIASLAYFIRVSPSPKAPAVIEFADKSILRAECAGFAREVHCTNGSQVRKGDVLAVLENPTKETELKQLRLDVQHSELRRRRYFEDERLAAYQAETEHLHSLREKLESTQSLVDSLTIRAPVDGFTFGRNLESLSGRYIQPGTEVLSVVPEKAPRVLISVRQKHVETIAGHDQRSVLLRLRGFPGSIPATLERVESRATTAVPHFAIASTAGGPLLVRGRARLALDRETGLAYERGGSAAELSHFAGIDRNADALAQQELTEARFAAYAVFDEPGDLAGRLREGVWGYVKLANVKERRLGPWLGEKIELYVRSRLEASQAGGF